MVNELNRSYNEKAETRFSKKMGKIKDRRFYTEMVFATTLSLVSASLWIEITKGLISEHFGKNYIVIAVIAIILTLITIINTFCYIFLNYPHFI